VGWGEQLPTSCTAALGQRPTFSRFHRSGTRTNPQPHPITRQQTLPSQEPFSGAVNPLPRSIDQQQPAHQNPNPRTCGASSRKSSSYPYDSNRSASSSTSTCSRCCSAPAGTHPSRSAAAMRAGVATTKAPAAAAAARAIDGASAVRAVTERVTPQCCVTRRVSAATWGGGGGGGVGLGLCRCLCWVKGCGF